MENIANGGVQYVPQIAVQYVYLDFDGELTSYNGEIVTVDNVEVQNSSLTEERIADITAELNALYADKNVIFVTKKPETAGYSTIYIGKTSAFDQYGNFAGLAETIDEGNQNSTDNAFVMLDSTSSNETIISTIAHETDHLLGTLNHGGSGLAKYADRYVITSGVTSTGIQLYYGSMFISSGGVANSTTMSGGYIYISNGGVANSTTMSGGYIYISNGGTANSTTVHGGFMYISSGGTANSTTVNARGYMYISSGGVANETTVNSWGSMSISSGGVANSTTVNKYGRMYIYGGVANDTTVNSDGDMYIFSGGTALEIKENGGYVDVAYGANVTFASNTINGLTLSYDSMTVHSNTVANNTTVNSMGSMYISSGGTANETTVNDACMYISSGGTANSTTVDSGGFMDIYGGVANKTTVNSWGDIYISSGGVANKTTVNSWGDICIYEGGTANDTTLNSGGRMYISSDGVANETTVNSEGYICISSGGTATGIIALSGAMLNIAVASNTYIKGTSNGSAFEMKNAFISGYTVNYGGYMSISSGGTANSTTVNYGGYICISSGGVANETTVNSEGYICISSGGTANDTTVNECGSMYIESGGTATGIIALSGAMLNIAVASNTYIQGTSNGSAFEMKNAFISGYTVNSGHLSISSGGTANDTTVNEWGSMYIASGGTASIVYNPWQGEIFSSAGADVTYLERDACIYYGGSLYGMISKCDSISALNVISGNSAIIFSGGIANNTTVNYDGSIHISSGGVANITTLNSGGSMYISSGGIASNTTVNKYGRMYIYSDGVHRGSLNIEAGAIVSVFSRCVIDFTVAKRSVDDDYLINDLSLISGNPTYTITIAENQAYGTYKLAQGADSFSGMISIGTESENYGSITVNGDYFIHNRKIYSLDNDSGNLTLTVNELPHVYSLSANSNTITWNTVPEVSSCTVEYSTNNFANSLRIAPDANTVDTFGMPEGTYQWRVFDGETWYTGSNITVDNIPKTQKLVSDADGNLDLFFATGKSTWGKGYFAQHQGDNSTGEEVELFGKNRVTDVFAGSSDANILVLTDDANGDALFLDDVYTDLGNQARLSQINEIRAGAGNDIIDMTSSQFEYNGSEMTIYGGLGDDVIWAAGEDNDLFG
ncbi:MAG: AIDA repeat-containing protein, partial [Lentisphaeria bacterium]|nr:AIDA repeat-containing protein [Lentisphaeria bacterium]